METNLLGGGDGRGRKVKNEEVNEQEELKNEKVKEELKNEKVKEGEEDFPCS